ncbi:MAG: hypothetical protein DME33_05620 [Verrucomicrobia bacterium]|nr:MAG: hypothetical protein DME33_05620 [Verrucomicrobiota bacterium]
MSFIVRTNDDLQQFMRSEGTQRRFRKLRLVIQVPQMTDPEARSWESRLERLRQECGCSTGALGLCLFTLISVKYALYNSSACATVPKLGTLLLNGVTFVTGLILSAVAGKFIGLWIAASRFQRICLELQQRLRNLEVGR